MLVLQGFSVSEGVAMGYVHMDQFNQDCVCGGESGAGQREKFESSLAMAMEQVETLIDNCSDPEQREILEAYLLMIDDPDLVGDINSHISGGASAEKAVRAATESAANTLENLQDEYLRARASDIRDIQNRLLRNLAGIEYVAMPDCIYVAEEVFPSVVASLSEVAGVVSARGGTISHAAILVRAMGKPAVFGVGDLSGISSGAFAIVDGYSGKFIIDPDSETLHYYRGYTVDIVKEYRPRVAEILQGQRILVKLNISSIEESVDLAKLECDGIGIVRTEFLFYDRKQAPSEEEQFQAYRTIVENAAGLPVVIRTLDAGSDKPLSYIPIGSEPNPALGMRGLRVSLSQPDIFKSQLRAILRAAKYGDITVMYPMVCSPQELSQACDILNTCRYELEAEGTAYGQVKTGAMIEVPSAAIRSREIAYAVDYLSIGTNDLTQYTLAADRTNATVSALYSETDPAVLELIAATCEAGSQAGIPVAVCGEMASRVPALLQLLEIGVREISVSIPYVQNLKKLLS